MVSAKDYHPDVVCDVLGGMRYIPSNVVALANAPDRAVSRVEHRWGEYVSPQWGGRGRDEGEDGEECEGKQGERRRREHD